MRSVGNNCIALKSEVKGVLAERVPFVLLIYKESLMSTSDLARTIPSIVLSLLQDFGDVFPDEVPDGLPPLRGIEHQIDLILGAPLSNVRLIDRTQRKPKNCKGKWRNY